MSERDQKCGHALNRRDMLRVLGACAAVAAKPAIGKSVCGAKLQESNIEIGEPASATEAGGRSAQLPPASELKTLGLIGGTAWYSTVDYYRYINEAVNDAYGNNTNPPLLLYNMNNAHIQELQAKGQW